MSRTILFFRASVVSIAGCGGMAADILDSSIQSDASVSEASVDDVSFKPGADAQEDVWHYPYSVVDASGDCAASGWAVCCANSFSCDGDCLLMPDGGTGCSCYGIWGGCKPDGGPNMGVCCPWDHRCKDQAVCGGGH